MEQGGCDKQFSYNILAESLRGWNNSVTFNLRTCPVFLPFLMLLRFFGMAIALLCFLDADAPGNDMRL